MERVIGNRVGVNTDIFDKWPQHLACISNSGWHDHIRNRTSRFQRLAHSLFSTHAV